MPGHECRQFVARVETLPLDHASAEVNCLFSCTLGPAIAS
jgi:hypothetical protein